MNEFTLVTFSGGTTPEAIIRERLEADGSYPFELVGVDADIVREIVNQGIDSHLEAVFGEFEWKPRKVGEMVLCVPLCASLEPDSMICLLRRLNEYDSEDEERICAADSLRRSILETLDIEEV